MRFHDIATLLALSAMLSRAKIYYTSFINLQHSKISQWNDNKQRSNSELVKQTRMLHVLIDASEKQAQQSLVRNDYESAFT